MKWRGDHRSYGCDLSNRKVSPKNVFGASTGFEPMPSALALQCFTNRAMKTHTLHFSGLLWDCLNRNNNCNDHISISGFSLSAKDWPLLLPVRSSVTNKIINKAVQSNLHLWCSNGQCTPRMSLPSKRPFTSCLISKQKPWVSGLVLAINHSHIYSAWCCTVVTLNGSKVSAHFLMPLMLPS